MIYPLHLTPFDEPENAGLIQSSIDHWYSLNATFRQQHCYPHVNYVNIDDRGHSWTGAASMSALIGRPEAALSNLTFFVNGGCKYPFIAYFYIFLLQV